MSKGWVKLHRSIKDWQWYGDINCRLVMVELIITVNHTDSFFKGAPVLRGQRIIGINAFSSEVGISVQQMRSTINRLKSTNEITTQATNRYTLLTLVNYGNYQSREVVDNKQNNTPNNKPITNKQQTNNKPITTSKELKNIKIEEWEKTNLPTSSAVCDPAPLVFYYWLKVMGKTDKIKFTPRRKKAVLARLKNDYSVDDLKQAIDGCAMSPYHMGQSENGAVHDDLELICRNPEKVDSFMATAKRGAPTGKTKTQLHNENLFESMMGTLK